MMNVFVEILGGARLSAEEVSISREALSRGLQVFPLSLKKMERGQFPVPLRIEDLVFGSIPFVRQALRHLGCRVPPPDDYPRELRGYLGRRVWEGRAREIDELAPIFVKPRMRLKKFTGMVACGSSDVRCPPGEAVWFSEVVKLEDEARCYILNGNVLGVHAYKAAPDPLLNRFAEEIAGRIHQPVLAVDVAFAVKGGDRKPIVVEANHPFSIGNYGLDDESFFAFIEGGWKWLTDPVTQGRIDT